MTGNAERKRIHVNVCLRKQLSQLLAESLGRLVILRVGDFNMRFVQVSSPRRSFRSFWIAEIIIFFACFVVLALEKASSFFPQNNQHRLNL